MAWFRDIKAVLEREPETWLAYLHGQQTDALPLLTSRKPRCRGLLLQMAKYGEFLIRNLRISPQPELNGPAKFFVFAGSANQIDSLEQTIDALKRGGDTVVSVASAQLLGCKDEDQDYIPLRLTFVDAVRSLLLFVSRGGRLYRRLKTKGSVSVGWHFAEFANVYTYLAYFYRILSQIKPDYVVTANDHSTLNRSMLAVAQHLGIKTVYLQHASVSTLFPALRVDYAFLDGQCALDTYRKCEAHQPSTDRLLQSTKVILSGQKKRLRRLGGHNRSVVGVALNALDDVTASITFINGLANHGLHVRLRWHPRQTPKDIIQYRAVFDGHERVSLSDPRDEFISEFMDQIGCVIAGNSSIHLEAALVGVTPIYYEQTPADQPDYYGYVKHGLAKSAGSLDAVIELIKNTQSNHAPKTEAVRYYSATYRTEWEGREGELVSECLRRISDGKLLPVPIVNFVNESPPLQQHPPFVNTRPD